MAEVPQIPVLKVTKDGNVIGLSLDFVGAPQLRQAVATSLAEQFAQRAHGLGPGTVTAYHAATDIMVLFAVPVFATSIAMLDSLLRAAGTKHGFEPVFDTKRHEDAQAGTTLREIMQAIQPPRAE